MEDLQPGFRFYPTEEELVSFYLHNKLEGRRNDIDRVIPVTDIYNVEPCHLPKLAGDLCQGETEQWFFFSARQEREARGGRPSRTTASGYWKATGSPGYVFSSDNKVIGVKKTMVFYKGKAPTGKKTKWKMNEYRAIELSNQSNIATPKLRHEFSLCRIYVVPGSFRAFDRRPLKPQLDGDIAYAAGSAANSSQVAAVDRPGSSDTSYSQEGDQSVGPPGAGPSSTTNWLPSDVVQIQEHQWGWEQLNWL